MNDLFDEVKDVRKNTDVIAKKIFFIICINVNEFIELLFSIFE